MLHRVNHSNRATQAGGAVAFATEDMFGDSSRSSLPARISPATGDPPGHQSKQHLGGQKPGAQSCRFWVGFVVPR